MNGRFAVPTFDISVIIPVYNSEAYLEGTLQSVVDQTVGMKAIQVILVDDGSTDGSSALCDQFRERYPKNVTVIHQENAGVSAARNAGLEHVKGRFVTFLDSDDLWTPTSFKSALQFFEDEGDGVDLLVGDLVLFESAKSDHPLAYRFKKKKKNTSRLIALASSPDDIQSTIGNCFFRASAVADLRFDVDLATSEDTLFVARVLLDKCLYGAASECVYQYRKRADGSSLSQVATYQKHLQNLEVCRRLYQASRDRYGFVQPFIQATALYIINWQLFGATSEPLTEEQGAAWQSQVLALLDEVTVPVIARARWMSRDKRMIVYRMKQPDFFTQVVWADHKRAYYQGHSVLTLNAKADCDIFQLEKRGASLHIEGTTDLEGMGVPYQLYLYDRATSERFDARLVPYPARDKRLITGEVAFKGMRFIVDVPLRPQSIYSVRAQVGAEGYEVVLSPHFELFAKFVQTAKHDYCVMGDVVIKHMDDELRTYRRSARTVAASEWRRLKEIMGNDKFDFSVRAQYAWMRLRAHLHRALFKKPIWIFADKEWKAGDNAENVYRYAMKSGYQGAKMYFALEKSSSDYEAVKSYGHVLDPRTFGYRLRFLLADIVVSSRTEMSVIDPFGQELNFVKDMLDYDLVYLTHGTLFGDLTSMLGKASRPIKLFSVSTQMERNALVGDDYGYLPDEVAVLGMARYDGYDGVAKKRVVAFLPTWRANIAGPIIPGTSEREEVPGFADTDYCKFYNGLINNQRLLEAMEKHGYTGEFYVHPAFEQQAKDFKGNTIIKVGEGSADYERVLGESAILVTDYSGVGFDFGYQRQPLVYCQYDSVFGTGHSYGEESYFSYEEDGFGPIAPTLEGTVDAIVSYIERDCQVEQEYLDRADAMFGFSDYNNCQRIFDAVVKLSQEKTKNRAS